MSRARVILPNGQEVIIDVPEGMSQEQIESALRQQMPDAFEEPELQGRDVARSALQGASLGFGDEITGALGATAAALTGNAPEGWTAAYRDIRDMEREEQARFAAENPGVDFAAQLVGGLATGGAGSARAAGTNVGRRLMQAPLRNRLAAATGIGFTGGGVAGLGTSEAETLPGMARDAAVGAGVGAALGPVAEMAPAVVSRVARWADPLKATDRRIANVARESSITPGNIEARMAAAGPGSVVADIGEGPVRELRRATQRPGRTADRAARNLTRRTGRQMESVMEPLESTVDGRAVEDLIETNRARANELYETAFARDVDNTPVLRNIFDALDETNPQAWQQARERGVLEALGQGRRTAPNEFGDAMPNLRGWRVLGSWMRGQEGRALRAGDDDLARQWGNVRRRMNAELDRQNKAYGEARKLWADAASQEEAAEMGRFLLRADAETAAREFGKLNASEKAAARLSMVRELRARLEKAGITHDATRIFNTPAMRKRLQAVMTRQEFRRFERVMREQQRQQRTFSAGGQPTAGSQTYGNQARDDATMEFLSDVMGITREAAAGNVTGAARQAAGTVSRLAESGSPTAVDDAMGRWLLTNDPARARRELEGAIRRDMTPNRLSGIGGPVGVVGTGAVAPFLIGPDTP